MRLSTDTVSFAGSALQMQAKLNSKTQGPCLPLDDTILTGHYTVTASMCMISISTISSSASIVTMEILCNQQTGP